MIKKYHNHILQTNPWDCEEEPHSNNETPGSKATSSFFQIKMIAKLEWTYICIQPNIIQLQTLILGFSIKTKSTSTEPPPQNG